KATGQVTKHAAELAAAWCDYLESHARRIYGLVGDMKLQAASALVRKIEKGLLEDAFTVRDIYRKEWTLLNDKDVVQEACDELVDGGWLRERIVQPTPGQKGKITYLINPKIRGDRG